MKRRILSLLAIFGLSLCLVPIVQSPSGEIDMITVADWIIDGDTFDTTSEDRVRLADIDAPEYGESGYYDARGSLSSLIEGKTVYLDIDDVYQTDKYGRLVCVVYVKHNSTHYLNVNKALLGEGVAVIMNYYNEFSPYTWTLYVHKDVIPEFQSLLILPLFMIATLAIVVYVKKREKGYGRTKRTY